MLKVNGQLTFYNTFSQKILALGSLFSRANPLSSIIDTCHNLSIEESKDDDTHIPTPIEVFQSTGALFVSYHSRVLRHVSLWSHHVRNRVATLSGYLLYPLSCCEIGRAIRHVISYNIIGNIAQSIAFCALQVFHLIPYVVISTAIAGSISLYHNDPYTLTAILTSGMLTTQIWFIYRLVKTVESTKKTLEHQAEELIAAISLVGIIKNTARNLLDTAVWGLRWTVSWTPVWKLWTRHPPA